MYKALQSTIAAVIFDWAGAVVDHGSLTLVRTRRQVFACRQIAVANNVARHDMRIAKRDQIRKLPAEPEVQAKWQRRYQRPALESGIDGLYQELIPLQMACLLDYVQLIEGVVPIVDALRSHDIRIGGTTGHTGAMLETAAREQGYRTDGSLCPEDVGVGRLHQPICYQLAVNLKAASLSACVKIGDTISDIGEGRNAGMWTIGRLRTGNIMGLSAQDGETLTAANKRAPLDRAEAAMRERDAHYVIDSVANALSVIEESESSIQRGERP